MTGYATLKEFGEAVHLSPAALRDRIKVGRLKAVKRYRGGNRDDPRSYRYLISPEEQQRFLYTEITAWFAASERGRFRQIPRFVQRDGRGRYRRSD